MPETTNALEAALNQLLQERNELDVAIAALQKRLGLPVSAGAPASPTRATTPTPTGDVVTYHGEFHNLSTTRATEKVLQRAGRPLKTPEILRALRAASYEMNAKNQRTSLYSTLKRSPLFVKVLPDTWDLAERHPQAAVLKQEEKEKSKKPSDKPNERKKPQGAPKAEQPVRAIA